MAKKHLYEIDLMRTFIMLGVLAVHTVTLYMQQMHDMTPSYLAIAAVHSSAHFTRESFMFITGLVLFVTYYHRDFNPFKFWWKRLTLIAVPYVVWAILDTLFQQSYSSSPNWSFTYLLHKVLHLIEVGDAFHLYYILVSIQLYIIFPIMLYGLRKLERWHVHIFIISFIFQVALMAYYEFFLPNEHTSHWPYFFARLAGNHGTFVLTYQFWFIAGGILACHYQKILDFVGRHKRALWTVLVIGVVVMWGHYFFNRFVLHQSDGAAEQVEQPLMIPYCLVVTAALWYAGVEWSRRRGLPNWRPFSWFIRTASNASFGIYLLQIYPIYLVQQIVDSMNVPRWVFFGSIPFAILFVYLSAMFVSHWIGKIPYVSYIVGRKVKFSRQQPVHSAPSASA